MPASIQVIDLCTKRKWSEAKIKEVAEQDRKMAMDMIIRSHREQLLYHALCIVKDEDEAYDLVQEVFIRAIRETRFFQKDFRMKAWLYRVTTNLCFNNVRNRKRRAAILDAEPISHSKEADQIAKVFEGERRIEVMAAMSRLSSEHQKILILRYYDDLSYAEIAHWTQLMECSLIEATSLLISSLMQKEWKWFSKSLTSLFMKRKSLLSETC